MMVSTPRYEGGDQTRLTDFHVFVHIRGTKMMYDQHERKTCRHKIVPGMEFGRPQQSARVKNVIPVSTFRLKKKMLISVRRLYLILAGYPQQR